jgi:hypothetical protein
MFSYLFFVYVVRAHEHMNWVRREGGDDILLTVDNVDEYVELLPKIILVDSIRPQLEAFRNGFRSPVSPLIYACMYTCLCVCVCVCVCVCARVCLHVFV